MKAHRALWLAALLGVAVGAGPVAADPGETSRVDSLSAAPGAGGTVEVSGEVTFAGMAAAPIMATDHAGDARAPGVGADLTSLSIDSKGPATLVLALGVADLPGAAGGTSEAVEYRILLLTSASSGGDVRSYWVQAIRSSQALAPGSQEPSFRLLPAVLPPGGPTDGVAPPGDEIAELTGSFSSNAVTVEVPWEAVDVGPGGLVWMSDGPQAACTFAACVVSAASASGVVRGPVVDYLRPQVGPINPYILPGEVSLGIAPAGTPAGQVPLTRTVRPTLEGSFSTTFPADEVPSGDALVAARVCFGPSNCHLASTTVTV